MTRKEAIRILKGDTLFNSREKREALDMAISSLETDAIPRERIEQMVAEIGDVYVGYRHAYEVKHDIMQIIHKYTKEQTDD